MRILVVDDEPRFASVVCRLLRSVGYKDVDFVPSGEEALEQIGTRPCDVLITDLRLNGMDGLTLMAEVKRRSPGTDAILMTAFADVETAKSALKRGALDYLVKPFDNDELVSLIRQAQARHGIASDEDGDKDMFAGMIGRSSCMHEVFEIVEKTARSDASTLILGASGTGKELAARALHSLSVRHQKPFVVIHSPAIPSTLLESELFGHEKGAFTGAHTRRVGQLEIADGGTVFLDEIAELPLELQPKILRFLQEHQFRRVGGSDTITVDVRVIAATNRDIEEMVKTGGLREDLFYRLDVVRVVMPALKNRDEDIELLARRFVSDMGRSDDAITTEALQALKQYSWPGNVRELQNVIERALIECEGRPIAVAHLPERVTKPSPGVGVETVEDGPGLDLEANETHIIQGALKEAHGNKSKAAKLLGITRRKLYSRIKVLGLDQSTGE